jgi:hypothetical protein
MIDLEDRGGAIGPDGRFTTAGETTFDVGGKITTAWRAGPWLVNGQAQFCRLFGDLFWTEPSAFHASLFCLVIAARPPAKHPTSTYA